MNHKEQQKKDEMKVFQKFADVLGICVNSIAQPDEPKPDILCELKEGTRIEYELGESGDKSRIRRTSEAENTVSGMRGFYGKSLDVDKKEKFKELYGNATILLKFKEVATKNKRRSAYPVIFEFLLDLPNNFSGDTNISQESFRNVCERIEIMRSEFSGLVFSESTVGHSGAGVCERIQNKFKKSYEKAGQLELLIHNLHTPLSPKAHWLERVQKYVQENLKNSPFSRVWVFNYWDEKIEYVYPEPNSTQ